METVLATLRMYYDSLVDAGTAFIRSPAALVGLLLTQVVIVLTASLVSPLGMVGGFILGLVAAGCVGAYLYLIAQALETTRRLRWSALRESVGQHLWDVIGVMFIFWIADLMLGLVSLPPQVSLVFWIVVFVLFNPAPELIYHSQARSMELLSEAFRWIVGNWPEWFFPKILLGALVYLVAPTLVLPFLQSFGPRFGFVEMLLPLVLGSAGSIGALHPTMLIAALGVPLLVHFVMLFRGALYRRLSRSSRRARAWRSRFD